MHSKHIKKTLKSRNNCFFIGNKINRLINEAKRAFYRQRIYQNLRKPENLWFILEKSLIFTGNLRLSKKLLLKL